MADYQNVPIPLGGGIDRSKNERALRAPNVQRAVNVSLSEDGAYVKRRGFTNIAPFTADTPILARSTSNGIAIFDEDGCHRLQGSTIINQEFGGLIPTEALRKPVTALRGATTWDNCALSADGTRLAVVCHDSDKALGAAAVCAILSTETWQPVWGPYRVEEIAWWPRVEAVGAGFMFLGMEELQGQGGEPDNETDLNAFYTTGTGAPSPSEVFSDVASPDREDTDNNGRIITLYDTCAHPTESIVYVVGWVPGSGAGLYHLQVALITTGLSVLNSNVVEDVSVDDIDSVTIAYEPDSDTLLVYSQHDEFLYFTDETTLAMWSSVGPTTLLGEYPVLYHLSGARPIGLNDRSLNFTGSSPGTPNISSSNSSTPTLHRRPVKHPSRGAWLFRRYVEEQHHAFGDAFIRGSEVMLLREPKLFEGGGVTAERTIVRLSEDRVPLWRHDHYIRVGREDLDPGGDDSHASDAVMRIGTIPQAASDGSTVVYVPQLVANAAYLPSPIQNEELSTAYDKATQLADPGDDFEERWANHDRAAFAGAVGDDLLVGPLSIGSDTNQLVVSVIRLENQTYSFLDFYGTTLVASGDLHAWDGETSFPAYLYPPLGEPELEPNEGPDDTFQNGPLYLENGKAMSFKGVLYTLDKQGIKYRSAPFDLGEIENDSGGTRPYEPEWTLELHPSLINALLSGFQLGLEVYATRAYTIDSPEEQFSLAWRGPLAADSGPAGLTYTADASDMRSVENRGEQDVIGPRVQPALNGSALLNPVPLYTDEGTELPPSPPPASSVMVHGGNYIFLLSSEDPYNIYHSKPLDERIGPEFNPLLVIQAPPDCGGVVSLAAESDRLVLLCVNGVWELFVGSGPDAAGDGSFPPFRKLIGGAGCITHRTTVSGPFGTFFVSESGPKLVTPSGEMVDIGKAVRPLVDTEALLYAAYHRRKEEVWLFCSAGVEDEETTFIYDLAANQWTTSTIEADVAIGGPELLRIGSNRLLTTDEEEFTDAGVPHPSLVQTAWVPVPANSRSVRVRRIGVHYDLREGDDGLVNLSTEVDYTANTIDTWTLSSEPPAGVDGLKSSRRKVLAVRITVYETTPEDEFVAPDWALPGLWLEVTEAVGLHRTPRSPGSGGGGSLVDGS